MVISLSMILSGAKNDTLEELKTLLNLNTLNNQQIFDLHNSYLKDFEILNSSQVNLNVANKIFFKKEYLLSQEFIDNLAKYYNSEAQSINFSKSVEATDYINSWVESVTNKKIQNFLNPNLVNELTRLVLVNAIYFKGKWLFQ